MKQYKTQYEVAFDRIKKGRWFDHHQITREHHGQWYCAKEGTMMSSFRVVMVPGSIIITGDLGELIFNPYHAKPLRWAYGDTFRPEAPYYPMTKVAPAYRDETFQPEAVTAWLRAQIKEARANGERAEAKRYIKMARKWLNDRPPEDHWAEQWWYELCHEFDEDDPAGFREHSLRTWYLFHAMCWFMSHVNPDDPRFSEELKA